MLALDPKVQISSSTAVNPGIPKTTYVVDATTLRNVVLVAGYDYPPAHGISHRLICEQRIEWYKQKGPAYDKNQNWRFTIFDFGTGEVSVSEFDPQTDKRTQTVKTPFKATTDLNYITVYDARNKPHSRFGKDTERVMSIIDIYEHVRSLGRDHPGSLWELSFYAHGYWGGPILLNSNDPLPNVTSRDPKDKDARYNKDFRAPTMDSAALAEFQAAFHVDGFVWVWGCNYTDSYRHVIDKLIKNSTYTQAQGPADTDNVTFTFARWQADYYFASDPGFFPPRDSAGKFPLTFPKTFAEVKQYFVRGLTYTYAAKIANASGRACYAALPGTYADYERSAPPKLMIVPTKKPPYKVDFTNQLLFYTKYVGIKLDPEGRGYGKYVPAP
jgi:hypothetical protein